MIPKRKAEIKPSLHTVPGNKKNTTVVSSASQAFKPELKLSHAKFEKKNIRLPIIKSALKQLFTSRKRTFGATTAFPVELHRATAGQHHRAYHTYSSSHAKLCSTC